MAFNIVLVIGPYALENNILLLDGSYTNVIYTIWLAVLFNCVYS